MKKVVVFGPWTGEFSYELYGWSPMIRRERRRKYRDYFAVHVGFIGRKALYHDFIDEYVPYDRPLHNSLVPINWGAWCNDQVTTPDDVEDFFRKVVAEYQKKCETEVAVFCPTARLGHEIFVSADKHFPVGDYKQLVPAPGVEEAVIKQLGVLAPNRDRVAVMARRRDRMGVHDEEDWCPKKWEVFLERLICDLNLNIVMIGVPKRGDYPGSLDFTDTMLYEKYSRNILSLVISDNDTVDRQLAVLRQTTCSIYGASGAAMLPLLARTPFFTQQSKENGWRLRLLWQIIFTRGHRKIRIFDKYAEGELYNTSVSEMFREFKSFYLKLKRYR